jgi:proteic killer suppression protein
LKVVVKLQHIILAKGVNPKHAKRLMNILAFLEKAETADDMDLPGLKLHQLKSKRKVTWAVTVSGNWRTTFKIKNVMPCF